MTGSAHPAPHRDRAPYLALAFCLFAPPIAWALHLLVNYSIAGQSCIGRATFGPVALTSEEALSAIFIIDLGAVVLAAFAWFVASDLWKKTREEKAGDIERLVHAGEGRTRFLAMCGMLTSSLFGVAVAVDALGSVLGPPC